MGNIELQEKDFKKCKIDLLARLDSSCKGCNFVTMSDYEHHIQYKPDKSFEKLKSPSKLTSIPLVKDYLRLIDKVSECI